MRAAFLLDQHEHIIATLGGDSPGAIPFLDDLYTEELSGLCCYDFKVPLDHPTAQLIDAGYRVILPVWDGYALMQVVETTEVSRGNDRSLSVKCDSAAIIELNASIVRPQTWSSATSLTSIATTLLSATRWSVGTIESTTTHVLSITDYPTTWAVLLALAEKYGREMRARVTLSNNSVTGRYIDYVVRRGRDRGKVFSYAKDLTGAERFGTGGDIYTAVIGLGKNLSPGNYINFKNVTASDKPAGQDWIGDEAARSKYGLVNGSQMLHRFGVFQSPDEIVPSEVLAGAREYLAVMKQPRYNYKVDTVLLERLPSQLLIPRQNLVRNSELYDLNNDNALADASATDGFLLDNYSNCTWTQTKLGTSLGQIWRIRSTRTSADGIAKYPSIRPSDSIVVPCAEGDKFTASVYAQNLAGTSGAGIYFNVRLVFYDSGMGILRQEWSTLLSGSEWTRYIITSQTAPAGSASVRAFIMCVHPAGGAANDYAEIEIARFQWERGDTASAFIATTLTDTPIVNEGNAYEHEQVWLGDTVTVKDFTFKPALALEARVISLSISLSDPSKDKCELGDYKELIVSAVDPRAIESRVYSDEGNWSSVHAVVLAASNSMYPERAHFVCDGDEDYADIMGIINSFTAKGKSGKIALMDGQFVMEGAIWLVDADYFTLQGAGPQTELLFGGATYNGIYADNYTSEGFILSDMTLTNAYPLLIQYGGTGCVWRNVFARGLGSSPAYGNLNLPGSSADFLFENVTFPGRVSISSLYYDESLGNEWDFPSRRITFSNCYFNLAASSWSGYALITIARCAKLITFDRCTFDLGNNMLLDMSDGICTKNNIAIINSVVKCTASSGTLITLGTGVNNFKNSNNDYSGVNAGVTLISG